MKTVTDGDDADAMLLGARHGEIHRLVAGELPKGVMAIQYD